MKFYQRYPTRKELQLRQEFAAFFNAPIFTWDWYVTLTMDRGLTPAVARGLRDSFFREVAEYCHITAILWVEESKPSGLGFAGNGIHFHLLLECKDMDPSRVKAHWERACYGGKRCKGNEQRRGVDVNETMGGSAYIVRFVSSISATYYMLKDHHIDPDAWGLIDTLGSRRLPPTKTQIRRMQRIAAKRRQHEQSHRGDFRYDIPVSPIS
ncbi:hypothetical protein SAMN05421819_3090 [Bryocella elongata]|uniref:Uncharacterized protein n=1 Tax=Bryocella elongata TaxID=863522 RepID=A0A1H6AEF3_9BACT|nr:hypothetical protein [Bryocella elongata]SEG46762.1 hypothetical protein SAMN05421819_3090 [Bryocella elongata]